MLDALTIVTTIAVLLFIGIICSWLAQKIRVPDVILLIIAGMLFGHATFKGQTIIEFPELFLTSMAILALAMIVFDSTARLRLREFDAFSGSALKLMAIAITLHLILISIAAHFILGIDLWLAILFAAIISGTSSDVLLPMEQRKNKALTLLKLESIFNTPLTVLLPFIVIDLMQSVKGEIVAQLVEQLVPFVMKFIVGIGAGVFIGLILFKVIQRSYKEMYSPLAVIIAALLSYVLAENLGGSGVLAVTALGLFFGNVYVKEKITLLNIESVLTKALFIFVFILVGLIIKIPLTKEFFTKAAVMLIAYYTVRYLAITLAMKAEKIQLREKIYMTLNSPKGIATAAVVFILAVYHIEGITVVLDMTLFFVLATIAISSIISWSTSWFIKS